MKRTELEIRKAAEERKFKYAIPRYAEEDFIDGIRWADNHPVNPWFNSKVILPDDFRDVFVKIMYEDEYGKSFKYANGYYVDGDWVISGGIPQGAEVRYWMYIPCLNEEELQACEETKPIYPFVYSQHQATIYSGDQILGELRLVAHELEFHLFVNGRYDKDPISIDYDHALDVIYTDINGIIEDTKMWKEIKSQLVTLLPDSDKNDKN